MSKIIGAGVEQIDRYEYQKKQYEKALQIWQEKADQERYRYCEKNGKDHDHKMWRGLFYIISKFKMEAFSAGIEGSREPDVVGKIECLAERCENEPMGSDFWEEIIRIIRASYEDGQKARR